MYWNYRVIRRSSLNTWDDLIHESFGIHEVFYNSSGKPDRWGTNPADVFGGSVEGIKECLECMLKAFDRPILTERKNMFGRERLIEWEEDSKS